MKTSTIEELELSESGCQNAAGPIGEDNDIGEAIGMDKGTKHLGVVANERQRLH